MKIELANPRGFCAGVDRAIEIVEKALEMFGSPIYVRHEVVHNTYVEKNWMKYPIMQRLFLVLMGFLKRYKMKQNTDS